MKRFISVLLALCMVSGSSFALAASDLSSGTEGAGPVITVQPESCRILPDGTATLSVAADGSNLSYRWYRLEGDEGSIESTPVALFDDESFGPYSYEGTGTDKLVISHNTGEVSGLVFFESYGYFCIARGDGETATGGTATSETATVTLTVKTVITKQPESCDILIGGTATFSLYAAGENLSYQWYRLDQSDEASSTLPVALSDTMAIGAFTFQGTNTYKLGITHNPGAEVTPGTEMGRDDAVYHCVVTGDGGTATSESVFLTFVSAYAQTPQVSEGGTVSVLPGGALTLTVTASVSDGGTLSYQWSRSTSKSAAASELLPGATEPVYSGTAPSASGLYFYFCTVTNTREDGATADAAVIFAVIVLKDETEEPYVFPFADVSVGSWYYFDVLIAHREGLIDGTSATTFSPGLNMTIAEAVKLAACMHQLHYSDEVTLTNGAAPLPWYQSYVDYAIAHGIISATDYPDFTVQITREEFVRIFYHALPKSKYSAINYVADGAIPDVPLNGNYADEIYTFYRAGILIGSDSFGTFRPTSKITRCEVAAILTRMFEESARQFITLT